MRHSTPVGVGTCQCEGGRRRRAGETAAENAKPTRSVVLCSAEAPCPHTAADDRTTGRPDQRRAGVGLRGKSSASRRWPRVPRRVIASPYASLFPMVSTRWRCGLGTTPQREGRQAPTALGSLGEPPHVAPVPRVSATTCTRHHRRWPMTGRRSRGNRCRPTRGRWGGGRVRPGSTPGAGSMTVQCDTCGREWEQDPARQVACPQCPADIGQPCKRPSGHPAGLHAARDKKALREVEGYERCPATPDGDIDAVEETVTTQQTRLEDLAGGDAA